MPLMRPDFITIEEAVRRLDSSLETLQWNIANGHVRVYIQTPSGYFIYPKSLAGIDANQLNKYARVENVTHWYEQSEKDGTKQNLLAFNKLVILDSTRNEIRVEEETKSVRQTDLFIYLPELQSKGQEEQEAETPPKLWELHLQAEEQVRVWLRNGDEGEPSEFAKRLLKMEKFASLNKRTLGSKAKKVLIEEGRKDLLPKGAGRPKNAP